MRRFLAAIAVLLLLLVGSASAELVAQRAAGSITTFGTDCTTSTTCVVIADIFRTVGVTIQLSGTFTGTVQFEGTADGTNWVAILLTPLGTSTAVTSATAPGAWGNANIVLQGVRARASALASGSVSVAIIAR